MFKTLGLWFIVFAAGALIDGYFLSAINLLFWGCMLVIIQKALEDSRD